jgi:hypothetical protein
MGSTSTSHVANPGPVRPPRIFLAAIILCLVGHLFWRDQFVSRAIGIPLAPSWLLRPLRCS